MTPVRRLLVGGEMRQLSRYCKKQLLNFPLPDPFTLDGLIANIELARDCSIRLVALGSTGTDLHSPCGLHIQAGPKNFILYRRKPTPNQTFHSIFHEISHLWLDHGKHRAGEGRLPQSFQAFLFDHLGADRAAQARVHYDRREEREAELMASLIRQLIRQQARHGTDLVSAMEASLTHPLAPLRPSRLS
ncbi:hypothetical protein [Streptomyces sp. TLI_146]|uniref:hypothetical protein n=1 Tax=Streptomyces sp. TLI_146 TaxID=1938858 RepID=UPI000C711570|nr:hypothetical protein [Streptomyces sp. TLI_146]PKV84245.1 hypothetical protein BX283_1757 [Streptomyces sp. TLI_146]